MKTKTFNPVDYLENDQEISEYLHEAFLDDDPQVFVIALGHLVKHHGVAKIADITGLNRESLYKTLKGDTKPTWETMHRLIKGLKLDVNFESTAAT
ncbi:addiction module antidote protein [Psychrobacter lutiphocae]|uniref:addiction module antidote protein n=1 Tax=Psychrobacter lutiphocae TaxID=540500 RepID=UPI00036F02D8|nr:addiction module antidote protein [Psychrobacter lutiphocae]